MAATSPSAGPGRLAGFAALEDRLKLKPVQPLTTTSRIGRSRATQARDGFRAETYPPQYEPEDSLRGHFEFGLKYDDFSLEWLKRFFTSEAPAWIAAWVRDRPTSQYARRSSTSGALAKRWMRPTRPPPTTCRRSIRSATWRPPPATATGAGAW